MTRAIEAPPMPDDIEARIAVLEPNAQHLARLMWDHVDRRTFDFSTQSCLTVQTAFRLMVRDPGLDVESGRDDGDVASVLQAATGVSHKTIRDITNAWLDLGSGPHMKDFRFCYDIALRILAGVPMFDVLRDANKVICGD